MSVSQLLEERAQLRHVLPRWDSTPLPDQPLTPFLQEIQAMVFEWACRIREQQQRTATAPAPAQGPAKMGTGVRQITEKDLSRKRTR